MTSDISDNNKKGDLAIHQGTKEAMIHALERARGIVSPACKAAGISRDTHYRWLKEDPHYRESCYNAKEEAKDFVESKLLQLINGIPIVMEDGRTVYQTPPDKIAVIFYLKTQCKDRGYVERQEMIQLDEIIVEIEGEVIESRSSG